MAENTLTLSIPFEVCVENDQTHKTLLRETFFFFDRELSVLESFNKLKEDTCADVIASWPGTLLMVKISTKITSSSMAASDWRNLTQFKDHQLAQVYIYI